MQKIIISLILISALGIGGSGVYKTIKENKAVTQDITENANQVSTQSTSTEQSPVVNPNTSANSAQNFTETRDFGADGFEDENEAEDDDDRRSASSNVPTNTSNVAPTKTPTPVKTTITASPTTTNQPVTAYSLAQIAQHADAKSCYTAVRGTVYDLTSFITQHPGGASNILKICGKDGTSAFVNQHAGRPTPEQELAGHEIGVFAN
ncbi:cytochrome b5 domain-containing protein [Candidatus Woesebacteria bacterium]|nr:cytochrome b5 domain-containing protein [Candidatus Woesebacteria bacterium]